MANSRSGLDDLPCYKWCNEGYVVWAEDCSGNCETCRRHNFTPGDCAGCKSGGIVCDFIRRDGFGHCSILS